MKFSCCKTCGAAIAHKNNCILCNKCQKKIVKKGPHQARMLRKLVDGNSKVIRLFDYQTPVVFQPPKPIPA